MIPTTQPKILSLSENPLSIAERFQQNVRQRMTEQQVSQALLAKRLTEMGRPMTRAGINQLLTYEGFPRMDWIELIARALGVEIHDLV